MRTRLCGNTDADHLPHSDVTEPATPARRPTAFRHDAVLYRGPRGFVGAVAPFVRQAVERCEPVLVAVVPEREQALRNALGSASAGVEFVDMQSAGRNPACIIPVWKAFVERHAGSGKPLNGVGEPIWAERTAQEIAECQRHESLLNLAFAEADPFALICPYDEDGLPSEVVAAARESHPHVVHEGRRQASSCYHGVEDIVATDSRPLPAAPPSATPRRFAGDDLAAVRREVAEFAITQGVRAASAADLALAVHEAAVNSIRHAGGQGEFRAWSDEAFAVCEICDAGALRDPLAGRTQPPAHSHGGRGLWLINHLCDLVQIRATPTGLVIRMHQQREAA